MFFLKYILLLSFLQKNDFFVNFMILLNSIHYFVLTNRLKPIKCTDCYYFKPNLAIYLIFYYLKTHFLWYVLIKFINYSNLFNILNQLKSHFFENNLNFFHYFNINFHLFSLYQLNPFISLNYQICCNVFDTHFMTILN